MDGLSIIISFIALILGTGIGYFLAAHVRKTALEASILDQLRDAEKKVSEEEKRALTIEKQNEKLERDAEKKSQKIIDEAKEIAVEKEKQAEKNLARLEEREKVLDQKVDEIEKQRSLLHQSEDEVRSQREKLDDLIKQEQQELEKISELSKEDAKQKLFDNIEKTAEDDLVNKMHRMEERLKHEVDEKARNIIVQSVQRLASDVTNESTVSHVELENDDLKGRIIGKEGRNINAFERNTGVNLVIDDTPNVVIISSFDPMRRHIASEVLKELLADGRIHPARIEEVMRKKVAETDKLIQQEGEKAVYEAGVTGLPQEVVKILGRLQFRTSYGQNVLKHSVEVSIIAEALANELGADAELAKKAGLLHDLGKTLSHEIGGKHALLSGDIARKFKLDEKLVHAIEAHHEDIPIESIEAYITQAADAVSASRPGARRETSEKFVKRMIELEGIATSFKGVNRCFAMAAGREMWVFVNPDDISDLDASKLSWEISRRIENDVQYPGEVKVVVHRDSRFINVAT